MATLPSRTGVAGRGLMLKGPYNDGGGLPSGEQRHCRFRDFQLRALDLQPLAIWGFLGRIQCDLQSSQKIEIAPYYANQICYDGSQYYWAVGSITGTARCFLFNRSRKLDADRGDAEHPAGFMGTGSWIRVERNDYRGRVLPIHTKATLLSGCFTARTWDSGGIRRQAAQPKAGAARAS